MYDSQHFKLKYEDIKNPSTFEIKVDTLEAS